MMLISQILLKKQIHIFPKNFIQISAYYSKYGNKNSRITCRSYSQTRSVKELPGPPSYPLIGCLPFILKNGGIQGFFDMMHVCAKRYGNAFKMTAGPINMYCFTDPDIIEEVFRNEGKFPRREYPLPLWLDYHKKKDLSDGLFISEGERWYTDRTSMNINLLKPKTVEEYIPGFNIVTNDLLRNLRNMRDSNDEIHGIEEQFFKWSLDSVATVVFDRRLGCFESGNNDSSTTDIINAVQEVFSSSFKAFAEPAFLSKIYKTKAYLSFTSNMDKVYVFIEEEIKKTLQSGEDIIIDDGEKNNKVGFIPFLVYERKMEMRDLMSNIMSLVFAAVETTSTTLLWTLLALAKNPAVQESLYSEVVEVFKDDEVPSAEQLRHMPYTRAIFKETMRLFPIAPVNARRFAEETVIDGYKIPADDMVILCHEVACRNADYFPDPLVFQPERWLRENKSSTEIHPFASLPFGFGSRMCIGRRLAEQELYIILSRLIKEYRIEYNHEEEIGKVIKGIPKPNIPLIFKFIKR